MMKAKLFAERGQALILITLAAIGLFAIAGLAIDGSIKYADRRHAQNAADTAVLAGALELARKETPHPETWSIVAKNIAEQNGYDGDLVHSQVWVYFCDAIAATSPTDCGPYTGYHSYIQVVIVSHVDTYFARVLGIQKTTNSVQAVAHWAEEGPMYGPELLKSYNPNPCTGDNGNITFGGNGTVTLDGGGAYINSGGDGSCGMEFTGCGNLTVINGGTLSTIAPEPTGNINLTTSSGHCTPNLVIPPPTYGAAPTMFKPEMPPEPSECTPTPDVWGHWNNVNGTSYMEPGWYQEFPPKKTATQNILDNIVMNPGVYCVDSVIKLIDQHLILTGHGVTIYIRQGGEFDVQGGRIDLQAPTSGPYKGYLLIINSDFTGTPPNCTINGDSHNIYIGTIFAPFCDFVFNGTNETGNPDLNYGTQVIAYTITLNGNSNINLKYDPGKIARQDPQVGLLR